MDKSIIFLDVDGTLVNDNGIVPNSAEVAIKETKKNGHLIFLSTGRSKAELFDHIMDIGFDGIIAAAGGYIELNNKTIMHKKFKEEEVKEIVEYFNEKGIDFYLEANGGLFASKGCKEHLIKILFDENQSEKQKEELEKGMKPFIECLINGENLYRDDINKISFLGSNNDINEIIAKFSEKFNIIPSTVPMFGDNSGEVSLKGIHKANAIEVLLEHLGVPNENTYAYGDGINDKEMLEFVNIGVAMGNAKEELKAIADDITDIHDNDGIYNSFKKYGLI